MQIVMNARPEFSEEAQLKREIARTRTSLRRAKKENEEFQARLKALNFAFSGTGKVNEFVRDAVQKELTVASAVAQAYEKMLADLKKKLETVQADLKKSSP